MAQPHGVDVVRQRAAGLLAEQVGEVGLGHVAHIREKGESQGLGVVEVRVGDAALDQAGVVFHGVVAHQQAVFVDHLVVDGVQIAHGPGLVDADGELGGELVNVVGVHMALLDGLAAEGVEDNQHVFPVDQGVFRPGGDPVGFEQAVIPGRLHVVPAGDGLQHLVLHLVALLDGVDGDGGGVV